MLDLIPTTHQLAHHQKALTFTNNTRETLIRHTEKIKEHNGFNRRKEPRVSSHLGHQKPEMSYQEFRDYSSKVHGQIFIEMDVVRKHCLRYE